MWGLCLLVLVVPLAFNPYAELPFEPVKVQVVRVGALGLFLLALMTRQWHQSFWWVVLVVVWGALTAVSLNPSLSVWGTTDKHGFLTWLACLAVGWLAAGLPTGQDRIQESLLLGSVPICMYGLLQWAGVDPLAWQTDSVSMVLSTLGRSNFLAAYLAMLLPLTLTVSQTQKPFRWLVVLQLLCLLATQARAGWLAMMVGVLVWFLWQRPFTRRTHLVYPLCFVLLAGGVFWGVNQVAWGAETAVPATEPTFEEVRSASVDRRWIIWQATWVLWQEGERPLVGYGFETFQTEFLDRYPAGSLYDGRDTLVDDPHNLLLRLVWDVGLIGLCVWGVVLCRLLWSVHRQHGNMLVGAYLAGITTYGVQAMFNPDVVTIELLFWLFVGCVVGVSNR